MHFCDYHANVTAWKDLTPTLVKSYLYQLAAGTVPYAGRILRNVQLLKDGTKSAYKNIVHIVGDIVV